MLTIIEFCLCAVALAVAYAMPRLGARWLERAEDLFRGLAERRRISVLLVGLLALAVRAAVLPILPIPKPQVGDEFSYLFMADTFAHGRVANPTHPMWVHFETFHIIQRPTNVSIYYPAQGLFLALGQRIFGHPFFGVLLSSALMCAALCWMLQGWLPPSWALLGGLLAVIRIGAFSYWANSYWGGAVAAIGGALILGALPRITRSVRTADALWLGLGLAILFNSRPYESLFFSFPVAAALLWWLFRQCGAQFRQALHRTMLPLVLVLAITASGMLYYFWRTTGSPFRTPYMVDLAEYVPSSLFFWVPPKPIPPYHHAMMKEFYLGWEIDQYIFARSHPLQFLAIRVVQLWRFYLGPVLTLPLVALVAIKPPRLISRSLHGSTGFLLLVCATTFLGLLLPVVLNPHYAAPLTSAIYALVLIALRQVRNWTWQGEPTGRMLARAVPAICVLMLLLRAAAPQLHIPLPIAHHYSWCSPHLENTERARIQAELNSSPGRHVVVVRYSPQHNVHWEWVYNPADIDDAKVIWARDMGPADNRELIDFFHDRTVWIVNADARPAGLLPYDELATR